MESTTQTSKPNAFEVAGNEAYAMVHINLWHAVEFLLTKLEPVQIEDVEPNDRTCTICQQEYHVSEDTKICHAPVKTPCGHIFGQPCIMKWLDPLCYWEVDEDSETDVHEARANLLDQIKTSCPTCRQVFFPGTTRLALGALAARLWYWDLIYAFVGVARSVKEEQSREHLWQYIEYCRTINELTLHRPFALEMIRFCENLLYLFAFRLESQALTPVQERLRNRLEAAVGGSDLHQKILDKVGNADFIVFRRDSSHDAEENEHEAENEEANQPNQGQSEGS
ncbi:hypothetical protein MMC22_007902 [Lobaria immixta]|nr:hypothetical protein [Lobaria immixta]